MNDQLMMDENHDLLVHVSQMEQENEQLKNQNI